MEPKANKTDHRFRPGDKVEYGAGGPHGHDRLGTVVFEHREFRTDAYLILPLTIGPGEGTLPSVWPGRMVGPFQPERWARQAGRWHRTYAEIKRTGGGEHVAEQQAPPAERAGETGQAGTPDG